VVYRYSYGVEVQQVMRHGATKEVKGNRQRRAGLPSSPPSVTNGYHTTFTAFHISFTFHHASSPHYQERFRRRQPIVLILATTPRHADIYLRHFLRLPPASGSPLRHYLRRHYATAFFSDVETISLLLPFRHGHFRSSRHIITAAHETDMLFDTLFSIYSAALLPVTLSPHCRCLPEY